MLVMVFGCHLPRYLAVPMSDYPIIPILRLLRFPNLVVVGLTQWLVYYRVLQPALEAEGIVGVLTPWKFVEIMVVTLMITASGYLVNDLHDEDIDAINRPGTNPVEALGRDAVMWAYCVMLLGGYLVSLLLAFRLGERELLWIFPMAIGLLSIYSSNMKRIPFLGNFLVAGFCAGVPGVLLLAERSAVYRLFAVNPSSGMSVLQVCLLFMTFAFLATMLRELVKDLEDLEGDEASGRRTIPVLLGVTNSRWLALVFGLLVVAAILMPVLLGWQSLLSLRLLGLGGALIFALAYILYQFYRAKEPRDYHRVSTLLKVFLLGGLGLLALF